MLNGLDLFSGIGGLSLALAPWVDPFAYCENERYAQSVLLSRMQDGQLPVAPIWDDVCTLVGKSLPRIDILYGGFPCQDISVAGTGKGLAGKRSGLVFELLRLCEETKPAFIFLENVPGIRTRGGEQVGKALAALGYDCRWDIVSALEVGAPHKRERWFLLAHAHGPRLQVPRRDEIKADKSRKIIPDRYPGLSDACEVSLQPRGISAEFCVQESFWKKTHGELLRMDDGLSPQTHRIRALGNAVVPLQAREAFMRLMGIKKWNLSIII